MNAKRKQEVDHEFYDGFKPMVQTYVEPCSKCRGSGFIATYAFREAGRCYQCNGTGQKEYKNPADVRARNRERAAVSRAATRT
jgi:DnaJ-class molecular chaperone